MENSLPSSGPIEIGLAVSLMQWRCVQRHGSRFIESDDAGILMAPLFLLNGDM